ncbi:hypothetical protein LTR66_015309, partial [Elasticomyces elasticus]
MFRRRLLPAQIPPLLRPLRPPATSRQPDRPRPFTQNTPLLLVTPHPLRPQLPYLCQPSRRLPIAGPSSQFARLVSTETRRYVREQVWLAIKYTGLAWTMAILLAMSYYGLQQELLEREHPSPSEWRYWTRRDFRAGRARQDPNFEGTGIVDWAKVGTEFRHCLEQLENTVKDGKGLVRVGEEVGADGESIIAGIGPASFDVSAKSYPWRQGYFEVVMGCAKAAEFLDDMVRDRTRKLVFPRDMMVGPSNPDPRPTPPNMEHAPLEQNCDRPYAPPEIFYLRILKGKGFSTRQRLEAAEAYANWLEFKGLKESAEEIYRWGVDIACAALPDADSIIDRKSGVLKMDDMSAGSSTASPNLLEAATNLATHYARTGAVSTALPIYLSVLRARRTAPALPITFGYDQNEQQGSNTDYGAFISLISRVFRPP